MNLLKTAIKVTSRITDAVIYPVYLLYAALLFRVLGPEHVPEDRTERFADGHTAELAESRTG
jgi:hypothetical protein